MYLKISQKQAVTAEYWPIEGTVSITTIQDGIFETSGVIAEVRMNNGKILINKSQNTWLVNAEGVVLEVINRDYMWS